MADVIAALETELITKLFESVNYPWRMRIDGDRAGFEGDDPDFEVQQPGGGDDLSADEPDYLEEWVEEYLDADDRARRSGPPEQALTDLLQPYATGNPDAQTVLDRLHADPAGPEAIQTFLNRLGPKVTVEWVEFELSEKPGASLGNPIRLSGLKVAARLKAKACAKILGKEVCIKITSPWVRFENRVAKIMLHSSGLTIYATASVEDFDLVLHIKIGPIKFTVRIGITRYINRFLASARPTLIDASDLEIVVPGLGRRYKPTAVEVPEDPTTTSLQMRGEFGAA